jgi:hypothetical protein
MWCTPELVLLEPLEEGVSSCHDPRLQFVHSNARQLHQTVLRFSCWSQGLSVFTKVFYSLLDRLLMGINNSHVWGRRPHVLSKRIVLDCRS